MTLSNDQIKNITKKIYLARLNIINYDAYYGILLMNLSYVLSGENKYLIIKDRKLLINPLLLENYDMAELEINLITAIEKYLIKIGVYGSAIPEDLLEYESKNDNDCSENDEVDEDEQNGDDGREVSNGKERKDKNNGQDNMKGKENSWQNSEKRFWQNKVYETVKILQNSKSRGFIPANAKRFVKEYEEKNVNWKEQLQEFIQFDISDYSFTPPDRRYDDSPFFLPDFNEKDERIKNILFMIDTSGSMSDKTISMVYTEVKNCLEQFREKVEGYVGCFDAQVYNVTGFSDIKKFKTMRIRGGGGTSFVNIFKYINENMKNIELKCVIILTDGYAPYPDKKITKGLPILWLMTTNNKAPIGKNVFIKK